MDNAISIIENKIVFLSQYKHIESFKIRIFILKDVLKELKGGKNAN